MSVRLLLDEHYSEAIAEALRERGYDVQSVVAGPELRGADEATVFRWAALHGMRIVTENIKDFRPLLLEHMAADASYAPLLLVHPQRFRRGGGDRTAAIIDALDAWLSQLDVASRPAEDWLIS